MKKFTLVLLMGLLVFLGMSMEASAAPMCQASRTLDRPDIGPWPFGLEKPFPWRSIQGVWAAEIDGCEYHFIFKVSKPEGGRSTQLKIHQMDITECLLVAEGVGYEQDRVVRAQLMGKKGPQELKIHVFNQEDLRATGTDQDFIYGTNRNVVVMTLAPLGRSKSKKAHQLYKLSPDVTKACEL